MDVARSLLSPAVLGPLLIGALALAWFLAVRLRRVSGRTSELAASERQYRRLIEDSAEGIIIHRLGVIRFTNAAALRLFGFTDPAQAVGHPWLDLIAPGHREAVMARVDARMRGEAIPATVELEALRRDGSRFWLAATATVVEWEGSPSHFVSFVDISDRQRREAAEREAESLRSVTKLANAAAHEINNPLAIIMGYSQMLEDRLAAESEEGNWARTCRRAAGRIRDAVARLSRIVRIESTEATGSLPPILDTERSTERPDDTPR